MTEETPAAEIVRPSVAQWVLSDRRAMALVAAFGANLLMNVVNVVPWAGPVVEAMGDVGFETIALLIATSILRRDGKPLKALGLLAGLSMLKTGLNVLNLIPEIGSLVEMASELGIDLTQIWFLKEMVTGGAAPSLPAPRPDARSRPA